MSGLDELSTLWTELRAGTRALRGLPYLIPGSGGSASRLLEQRARRDGERPALRFEGRVYSWAELDRGVDRTAWTFRSMGVGPGDCVALLMDNRPEYLLAVTALSRLRATSALINTNVTGAALVHAVRAGRARLLLAGAEHREKVEEVAPELSGLKGEGIFVQRDGELAEYGPFADFDARLDVAPATRLPDAGVAGAHDPMCFIYTSGTTGLPKAAIVTNQRFVLAGFAFGAVDMELEPDDVLYVTLPLYHSNAMFAGWSAVLATGACMALRRRFSASGFWSDVRRTGATAFIYIGELCRYLLNQPEGPDDRRHRVRVATGNGLRPDIWDRFQRRFGVPLIREFYGATEGVSALINLEGRPGMVGRMVPGLALVRCDLESGEPLPGAKGFLTRVRPGETGLLLQKVGGLLRFDGYVDAAASRRKVRRDVFARGDAWFDTGDLLVLHPGRWVSFADRVGDTFRWKGENVSTNEVAEILNDAPGVLETNVYGVQVPGTEGRAGMASVHAEPGFSIDAFGEYVAERLPVYQRPYFVRVQGEMRLTGTFKHQKVDYRREGYDPHAVADPLYFLEGGRYVPLDEQLYEAIQSGRVALR